MTKTKTKIEFAKIVYERDKNSLCLLVDETLLGQKRSMYPYEIIATVQPHCGNSIQINVYDQKRTSLGYDKLPFLEDEEVKTIRNSILEIAVRNNISALDDIEKFLKKKGIRKFDRDAIVTGDGYVDYLIPEEAMKCLCDNGFKNIYNSSCTKKCKHFNLCNKLTTGPINKGDLIKIT